VITKGERAELRSLIRQRFKVLRADVEARKAELAAELQERITAKFAAEDKAWADAMFLVGEAVREANRKANDVLRGLDIDALDTSREYSIVIAKTIAKPVAERNILTRNGTTRIEAQVKSALLQLDRQEADLLTRLVAGALESDEARAFLGEIPTVSALVPADRLLELVGQLDDTP
jgi:hydroxylamine reductase (hybrid-cluster protein)